METHRGCIYNAASAAWPNNLGILEVYENQTQDFQKMKVLAEKLTTWTKKRPVIQYGQRGMIQKTTSTC